MPRPRKPIDEKYSAKITVSFLPETKRQIEILCSIDGITFNALMNELAENLCNERIADIEQYDNFIDNMRRNKKSSSIA